MERASGLAHLVRGAGRGLAGKRRRGVRPEVALGGQSGEGNKPGGGGGRPEAMADGNRGRGGGEWKRRRPRGVCDRTEEMGTRRAGFQRRGWKGWVARVGDGVTSVLERGC